MNPESGDRTILPENPPGNRLRPGTLRAAVLERTRHALATGALRSIPTDYHFVEDAGVRFVVRVLSNLERKDAERRFRETQEKKTGTSINPFLPYEDELYVGDVTDTHAAVLNKFNVVEEHLLIITRRFEEQEALLTPSDFEALALCLGEYESLGFYNGGVEAGASQRHKHLQVVPRSLVPGGGPLPVERCFRGLVDPWKITAVDSLPFRNAFCRLPARAAVAPVSAGSLHDAYRNMLARTGIEAVETGGQLCQSSPYCLLVTSDWLFVVPRSKEFFGGISVNSLGYAGGLLVRNETQMELVREVGPMRVLAEVGVGT